MDVLNTPRGAGGGRAWRSTTRALPGDDARFDPLIRATNHIAPYIRDSHFYSHGRYLDALKVVRAYVRGELMTLDRDSLLRVAKDCYGRAGRTKTLH